MSGRQQPPGDDSAGRAAPRALRRWPLLCSLTVSGLVAAMVALAGLPAGADASSSQTTVGIIVTGSPALTITKRGAVVAATSDDKIGGARRVRWTITVTNAGDTMLTALTVSDPKAGPVRCPTTSLAPKQVMTCTAPDHVITVGDGAAGVVTNVATASASAPGGQIVAPPGFASVRIPTTKPAVIFLPPLGIFGFPGAPPGSPGSDEHAAGGGGGGALDGGGSPGGAGGNAGGGPNAAGPASPNGRGGLPSSAADQQRAHPPVAVAGGQPDKPGHGGLTLVLLGAITAVGALAALGVRASRRTRRRR
ncbi:DUF7507 domain-containing protein [Frankia sp. AiPs1]|uniref:DUF7507 domain-containing protein n=1 Tax=Frankia sp. AiPa1 TaxID=573492 RepID=UPI00202B4FD6|nr:hypothetical protein [Frankia sp. AiPa1]MCL9758728.1 hypothetical protein [Frankia sp. AiPa1]